MSEDKCKCTMSQSMVGDGCKVCQPRTYIAHLEDSLESAESEIKELESQLAALSAVPNHIGDSNEMAQQSAQEPTISDEAIDKIVVKLNSLAWNPHSHRVSAVKEILEAQQPAQESWISVDERLPEANITVLVVTNFDCIYTCRLPVIISKNAALDLENGIRERFTHWMPLPLPPVSRSDEQPVKEVTE
jgi:hypothetical protein